VSAEPALHTPPRTLTMYSTPWCGYCRRLEGQLERAGIEFVVVDIEQHPEAEQIVMAVNRGNQTVPTVVFPNGTALTNPSVAQVREALAEDLPGHDADPAHAEHVDAEPVHAEPVHAEPVDAGPVHAQPRSPL